MESTSLVLIAAACGGAAIYFWTLVGKLNDQLNKRGEQAGRAEAEAAKANERAETLRKRLEKAGESTAKEDKGGKELQSRLTESKEELQKVRAALKRSEAQSDEAALKLRKTEQQIEELQGMLAIRKPLAVVAPVVVAAPSPVVEAAVPREEDPKYALRREELRAEREARDLERDKLNQEREAARSERDTAKLKEWAEKLKNDRDHWRDQALRREHEVRLLLRKVEHNRRAWLVTNAMLDLADEDLYRLRHGRELPEHEPNRAVKSGVQPAVEGLFVPDVDSVSRKAREAYAQMNAEQRAAIHAEDALNAAPAAVTTAPVVAEVAPAIEAPAAQAVATEAPATEA